MTISSTFRRFCVLLVFAVFLGCALAQTVGQGDTAPSVVPSSTTPLSSSSTTPSTTLSGSTTRAAKRKTTTTKDPGPDPRNPFKYYARRQEKLVKTLMKTLFEHVTPSFLGDLSHFNLSGECTYGLFKFIFGIKQLRPWAIKSK